MECHCVSEQILFRCLKVNVNFHQWNVAFVTVPKQCGMLLIDLNHGSNSYSAPVGAIARNAPLLPW